MADAQSELRMGAACCAFVVIGAVEAALGVLMPSLLDTFTLSTGSVTLLLASQIGGYLLAALLREVDGDGVLTTRVTAHPRHRYDQAGLLLRLSPACWIKTSVA
ncbi:DUF1349 domain-containing protein [Cyanobium sp. ULC065]